MGGEKSKSFFGKKVDLSSTQGGLCTVSVFFILPFYLFGRGRFVRTQCTPPAYGPVDTWMSGAGTNRPICRLGEHTHSGWRNLVLYGSRDPHLPGKGQFFLEGGRRFHPGSNPDEFAIAKVGVRRRRRRCGHLLNYSGHLLSIHKRYNNVIN